MGRARIYLASAALAGLTCAALPTLAQAQEAGTNLADVRDQGVMERARPGYDPVGIRAGSFMLFPTASVGESYNDNIYATNNNTVDDFITTLSAGISANSVWGRHALSLSGGVTQQLYADKSDEDRFNWNLGGAGRLDIARDTALNASARYAQLHEDRGNPNTPTTSQEPIEYDLFNAATDLSHRFNRVNASVGFEYTNYDYKDATTLGGANIDQDNRDRDEYTETARLGYFVSPDTNVYVEGRFDQRRYDLTTLAGNRDSDGWAALVGTEFKISRLTQGNVYAGYQERDYKAAALSSTEGLAYGIDVEWFATPLTTVTVSGDSRVEETTVGAASGYDRNSLSVNVDHELFRNVILSGGVSYTNNDFNDNPRNDDTTGASLGVKYLINRNFDLGLNYSYTNRDSNAAGFDYTRNVVGLTLTGKL